MVTKIKPYNPGISDLTPSWHVLDATDQVVGRLATQAAMLLMGKHKPTYVAHLPAGDFVVVTNASKLKITGKKLEQKVYLRHNQQPGHLKKVPYWTEAIDHPDRIFTHAVKGMVPKNKLSARLLTRLKVYAGPEHPHAAQVEGSRRMAAEMQKAIAEGRPWPPRPAAPVRKAAPVTEASAAAPSKKTTRRGASAATTVAAAEGTAPAIRRPRAPRVPREARPQKGESAPKASKKKE
jgi:large subunit ribosomal protein L13